MLAIGASRTISVEWHTLVPSLLKSGTHILDLGANIGHFSRQILEKFDCHCHAIEPVAELRAQIPEHPRLSVYQFAVAARRGQYTLTHAHDESPLAASILPSDPNGNRPDVGTRQILVEGIDLESFVRVNVPGPISLVKMDIEGAEIEVLDNLSEQFLIDIAQLSVEFHDFCGMIPQSDVARVVAKLDRLGFYSMRMSGIGHQDTLFVNRRCGLFGPSDCAYTRYVSRNVRGIRRVVERGGLTGPLKAYWS